MLTRKFVLPIRGEIIEDDGFSVGINAGVVPIRFMKSCVKSEVPLPKMLSSAFTFSLRGCSISEGVTFSSGLCCGI